MKSILNNPWYSTASQECQHKVASVATGCVKVKGEALLSLCIMHYQCADFSQWPLEVLQQGQSFYCRFYSYGL